ncbi:hypothetical protein RhiirA5_395225 [Rhizophagus irregularis]|uniref:2OGFeDO JBP1/TET oxygenase domain-containing protein n=1 Tax=Rhizophagus irregularis TaxID=588596 RepID=A0A2N0RYQ9_9GLOM|nr:hypothetical protein RhiirA5_395225 [Rhizophagus irregularis]PKC68406.1 hypothetical protein RhiirA1_440626 [Rhizophagus irregularis]
MHYDLSNFKIIEGNYCIDENKATLFRLFEVPKEKEQLIINADHAVQSYWTHIHNDFNHDPPKFKGFNYESPDLGTQPFTQHFGIFRSNNKCPRIICVKLRMMNILIILVALTKCYIYEINEVADYIANIMEFYYPSMYRNLSNLCFPPQVKKLFKVFGIMCAVNFNTICGYHIDRDDDKYGFCWLVPLGEWKGGDLIFPQLNIRIKLKPGNILAFRSNLLVHGNLPCSEYNKRSYNHMILLYVNNVIIKSRVVALTMDLKVVGPSNPLEVKVILFKQKEFLIE